MPEGFPGFLPSYSGEIAPLMPISSSAESELFIPWNGRTNNEQQEINKWHGKNGPRDKMGCCCLPPERVELTANGKKGTKSQDDLLLFTSLRSRTNSEQKKKWQGQNGQRGKMGCCCLPPERVKLTANSKKETSFRVKIDEVSK